MSRQYFCACGARMLDIANPWLCADGHVYGDPYPSDEESGVIIAVDASARKKYFPPHGRCTATLKQTEKI